MSQISPPIPSLPYLAIPLFHSPHSPTYFLFPSLTSTPDPERRFKVPIPRIPRTSHTLQAPTRHTFHAYDPKKPKKLYATSRVKSQDPKTMKKAKKSANTPSSNAKSDSMKASLLHARFSNLTEEERAALPPLMVLMFLASQISRPQTLK